MRMSAPFAFLVPKFSSLLLTADTPWGYTGGMKMNIKHAALRRLNIISGQMRGLARMVADEKYCIDIITQSTAARTALSSVEDLILENHLRTHVVEQMRTGRHEKAVKEILSVYKTSHRK